ncbi:MAG: hypothetical protein AAB358_02835 [Patescibacteria group bacterium]
MNDIIPPNFNRNPSESLKMISRCPICHFNYNPIEAKVLAENAGAHLLYIKCQRCGSAILALVLANSFGVSSVGLVTDLESYEVTKFKDADAITSDDILSVYGFLADDQKLELTVFS